MIMILLCSIVFVASEESAICFLHWYRRAAAMIIAPAKRVHLLTPISVGASLRDNETDL